MSRSLRIVLLVGCSSLGALHLPSATRALTDGVASSLGEVQAMERAAAIDEPVGESALHESLAQRD